MAQAAQALGLQYLTVTEHSQAAIYAGGLKEDDLKRQWDEIDRVNAKLPGFRLLKGIEADILEDGALDYPRRAAGAARRGHRLDPRAPQAWTRSR